MATPPINKTFAGLMKDTLSRLTLVERRLARLGGETGLPGRLAADLTSLGSGVDLNTVIETGWYIQSANANATLALNYPLTRAGHLEVSGSSAGADFVLQTYTEFLGSPTQAPARQFRRTYYSGTWSAWADVSSTRVTTDWNTATEPGLYTSNSGASNTPDSTKGWTGTTFWDVSGGLIQEVRTANIASTDVNFLVTYRRRWSGSNWSAWIVLTGGDTYWQGITLTSPWQGTSALSYRVKDGICYFKGEFYGGTDLTAVFTLPAEARPLSRLSFPCFRIVSSTAPPWGTLNIQTTGVATFVAMSGGIIASTPGYSIGSASYPVIP